MLPAQTEQNLQSLATRFPSVFSEVKSAIQSTDAGATDQRTRDYGTYLKVAYGVADPEFLRSEWVKSIPLRENHLYITTGIGDGSHLIEILSRLPQSSRLVVVEANARRIYDACEFSSLMDELLANPRFILLGLFNYRQGIDQLNQELVGIESASVQLFAPLYEIDATLYSRVLNIILAQMSTRWNQIRTDVENAATLFENTLANLWKVGLHQDINRFSNCFEGGCLALVAAGPSLDHNLNLLKQLENKAIIVVVNSAYNSVKAYGVKIDITVAVDPNSATVHGYKNSETAYTLLISPYVVNPGVIDLFGERIIGLSSHNPFMSVLRKILGFKEEPNIVGDGTVSITVANLAALFGCNSVLMIGQDLALTPSGQTHSSHSFYAQSRNNHLDTRLLDTVENNQGARVPIEPKLKAYLKTFEDVIAHYPQMRFYNLSKEGAKIKGASYIDAESALKIASESTPHNYNKIINQIFNSSLPVEKINYGIFLFMERYEKYLRECIGDFLNLIISTEGLETSRVQKLNSVRDSLAKRFEDHPTFASLSMEGETKSRYYTAIQETGNWKPITDEELPLNDLKKQAAALLDGYAYQIKHISEWLKAYEDSSQN